MVLLLSDRSGNNTKSIILGYAMSIPKVSIRQIKAARAMLAWSQSDLAAHSGISEPTIKRLESADGELGGRQGTGEAIRAALEKAGVIFVTENGDGPGVRLRKEAS